MSQNLYKIAEKIQDVLAQNNTCRIGLSGGSSPRDVYKQLGRQRLPWDRIELILIDERHVPPNDEKSNFYMLRDVLLSDIQIPPTNIFVFNTFLPLEESAKDMQQKIMKLQQLRHPLFDILILGFGPDGHIASLFPRSPALDSRALVTTTQTPENSAFPIKNRLTLTYQALLDTEEVFIIAPTDDKKKILARAQEPGADFHEIPLTKIVQELKCEVL